MCTVDHGYDLAAQQTASTLAKELFAQPALTIGDLRNDPDVALRMGRILELARNRAEVRKVRLGRHRRAGNL
jgi:hypothetical protein